MAADLAGLIATKMTAPVVAAGQSFGGNLVIELAARYPDLVSGVVCVDGGFVDLKGGWPDWEEALQLLTPPSLDDLRGDALAVAGLSTTQAGRQKASPPSSPTSRFSQMER